MIKKLMKKILNIQLKKQNVKTNSVKNFITHRKLKKKKKL